MTTKALEPVTRPAFALWLFDRPSLTLKDVGEAIECSHEQVRRFCLPFGDPNRRIPDVKRMTNIARFTGGQITAASFYPPEARGQGAEEGVRP